MGRGPRNSDDKAKCKKLQSRLLARYKRLLSNPVCNLNARINPKNIREWFVIFDGPVATPYEGGRFMLRIHFGIDYPFKAPKVNFQSHVFHSNIDYKGNICVDILKDKWSPVQTVSSLVNSIHLLLANPNPKDPLNDRAAKIYVANKEVHDRIAREITKKYATPNPLLKKNLKGAKSLRLIRKPQSIQKVHLDHMKNFIQELLEKQKNGLKADSDLIPI